MIVRCIVLVMAALVALPPVAAQGGDDDVRSGFLVSRKKKAKPARRAQAKVKQTPEADALSLGYTVFRRAASGAPVRVDPAGELRDGDMIRVVVEPNEDGYLYVFNTDDRGGAPVMIFPDVRLAGGENRVRAHVPYEFPSSRDADESLRWLHLAGGPVTDRLHVIVTREPLDEVPTGEALERLCDDDAAGCLWEPPAEVWSSLAALPEPARRSRGAFLAGRPQSDVERAAIDRSVRLLSSAPAPSVVVANASSTMPRLAAVVEIVHR